MNKERLNEIKDSINFQRKLLLAYNMDTLCVDEEQELIEEIDRLNNIINELEKELNEAYDELYRGELVNGRELINNIYQELKELKENK